MLMVKFDPKIITKETLHKCGLSELSTLQIERQVGSTELRCLENVHKYISVNGGEVQFGWILTLIGNVIMQLTAHAVVKRDDGSLLCVSLNDNRNGKIHFSVDDSIANSIKNGHLPSRYVALVDDQNLVSYVKLMQEQDKLRLEGHTLSSDHLLQIQEQYPRLLAIAKAHTKRNDSCFCGSGLKRKKCCG
ncbi:TPA: YecA family protein [Vibrio diabolicus]